MKNIPIIDSVLSINDALKQNPNIPCPPEILDRQALLEITYISFDKKLHTGQIIVDRQLSEDVIDAFKLMQKLKFPLTSVIPIADPHFNWDDLISMKENNTSGFNYRYILNTQKLSNHSFGRAIDINPSLNPYFIKNSSVPEGLIYDPSKPGTLSAKDKIVAFFKKRGWNWGGDWAGNKDYQHFEKPLL